MLRSDYLILIQIVLQENVQIKKKNVWEKFPSPKYTFKDKESFYKIVP